MSHIFSAKRATDTSPKGALFVVRPHTSYLDGPAVARWLTKGGVTANCRGPAG